MKLVEVIRGGNTSDETYNTIFALAQRDRQDSRRPWPRPPASSCNRLLIPMINEAIELVQNGVASAEGIDTAMKSGLPTTPWAP